MDPWAHLSRYTGTCRDRTRSEPDEHGFRAAANIRELEKIRRLVDDLIDDELIRGREQGASWGILGRSKQQAQQRHKRAVTSRSFRDAMAAKRQASRSKGVDLT